MYIDTNIIHSILIFSHLLLHPVSPLSDKMVNKVCADTLNYDYCKNIFNNNPRTREADMNELAIISVLIATSQARENKHVVTDLQNDETDPTTKSRLTDCFDDYTVVMGKLDMAYGLFDTKDYTMIDRWVSDAMKMTVKCETRFLKPPSQTSPIANYSQMMIWENGNVLAVLDIMLDQK